MSRGTNRHFFGSNGKLIAHSLLLNLRSTLHFVRFETAVRAFESKEETRLTFKSNNDDFSEVGNTRHHQLIASLLSTVHTQTFHIYITLWKKHLQVIPFSSVWISAFSTGSKTSFAERRTYCPLLGHPRPHSLVPLCAQNFLQGL